MGTQAEAKPQKRRMIFWALLPFLLLLLIAWEQHGTVPSADTREFRREVAGVTHIKVRARLIEESFMSRPYEQIFTMQGEEARNFVRSILFRDTVTTIVKHPRVVQIIGGIGLPAIFIATRIE